MAELKYDKKTGRLMFTKQMKKEYTNKKKVVLISCLCMGALAVILLF